MYLRKIQLIAGTTYSVSLPKEWIIKNKLKEKKTISLQIKENQDLLISPSIVEKTKEDASYVINADDFSGEIDQILFSLYYTGFEDIIISSKKQFPLEKITRIKRTAQYMSGSEIIYEDDKKIHIKVLLNSESLDLNQIINRIYLIISSTINSMKKERDKELMELNENEIDRLYHLVIKLISIASLNPEYLQKSNIKHTFTIVPYTLIAKRLEHLSDNLYKMSELQKDPSTELLNFLQKKLKECILVLMGDKKSVFKKTESKEFDQISEYVKTLPKALQLYAQDSVRCIDHIEEELVNITFYHQIVNR